MTAVEVTFLAAGSAKAAAVAFLTGSACTAAITFLAGSVLARATGAVMFFAGS